MLDLGMELPAEIPTPWHQWLVPHVLIFALKFSLSAATDTEQLVLRLRKMSGGIAIGVGCQFAFLPVCGALTCLALRLPPVIGVALIVVTNSPGGSFSNWWCSVINADLAMSVAMTAVSSMCGLIALPVNLLLLTHLVYGSSFLKAESYLRLFEVLVLVLAALFSGLGTSCWLASPVARHRFYKAGGLAGLLLMGYSAVSSAAGQQLLGLLGIQLSTMGDAATQAHPPYGTILAAVLTPLLVALSCVVPFTSHPALGLGGPQRVSVIIEACYQNVALGMAVALTIFEGEERATAVVVPLVYGGAEAVVLGLFCVCAHYLRWTLVDPEKVGLWEAISGDFQVRNLLPEVEDDGEAGKASRESDLLLEAGGGAPSKQA